MYDNVLLFISDVVPFMCKAGQVLRVDYSKRTHFIHMAQEFLPWTEVVMRN